MSPEYSDLHSENNPIFRYKTHPYMSEMKYPGMYTIGNPVVYGSYLPSSNFGMVLTFGMEYIVQIFITRDNIWYRLSTNNNIDDKTWTQIF